ncbi:MBL fold metallo-hydrolase [Capsulimonas corticalis]|uniref:MBL fold metallo-hydrolase n=1 Tax=Capsulimonas corticalis TaxID=2219043 RepID=A0A402D5F8_9BACT|nr:MBL fold metallo-hydrolase [Capsulimonas corticalis]BDI29848.1 MBL fold metallo-hydrolase [Capsulimonas corticalis]
MPQNQITMTYIGGPTALMEIGGLRLLTDPAFDPAGGDYTTGPVTLTKTGGPAVAPEALGHIDVVLLSHDHHSDNLDNAGRALLPAVDRVYTTPIGAERLGGNAIGLDHWQSVDVATPSGRTLRVTGTPGRHGPIGGDRGPVTGFVLAFTDTPNDAIYISGDTVWYEGVEEVARRFPITTAVLFMGAARVAAVGPDHLTMTAEDGIQAAHAFPNAKIIPLHFEGWAHFSESHEVIQTSFGAAGVGDRLLWLKPGAPTVIPQNAG